MSKKLYISSTGADEDSIRKGLRWLLENGTNGGILAVHQLSHLDGTLARILGHDAIKTIKKDYKINVSGCKITLTTDRRMIYSADLKPILALFPNPNFLDKLDSIDNLGDMLVVPWYNDEIKEWIRTRQAQELGNEPKSHSDQILSNKVVEVALQSLTATVNHSTGITHPSDKAATVSMFKILRDYNEDYDLDEVHAWLIHSGRWKADTAKEVVEIGKKIKEGKVVHGGNFWNPTVINTWRKEAKVTRDSSQETIENTTQITRTRVSSSNIHSIGHNVENQILEIAFLSGGTYRYFDVSAMTYDSLMEAPSHGRYFSQYIKGRYRERKIR